MSTSTTNLGLVKPAYDESADIMVINGNMDTIDGKMGAIPANSSVQGQLDSHSQAIGNLSNLTTTEKGSLVGAANELNSKILSVNTAYYDTAGSALGTVMNGATIESNVQQTHANKYGKIAILRLRLHMPTVTETIAVFQFADRYKPAHNEVYWEARNLWDSSIKGLVSVNADGYIYAQPTCSGKDLTIDITYVTAGLG